MKRTLLCALAIAAMSCGLLAQMQGGAAQTGPTATGRMPTSEQRMAFLTKSLNLTSDQQQKVKPILDNESQQMQALHQDTSMSPEDRRSKMQQIHQNTREQIKPILTADQQQKWDDLRTDHMHGGPHGAMDHSAAPQGQPAPLSNPQQ